MFTKKFYLKLLMGLLLVAFAAPPAAQAETLTVGNGTSTQDLGPIYAGKSTGFSTSTGYVEILYPKSLLTKSDNDMTGAQITGLVFYSNQFGFSGGTIQVQICETDNANLLSEISETPTTIATFSNVQSLYNSSTGELTFDFGSNSFTYSGEKNLLIRFYVSTKGSKDGRSKYYCNTTYNELGSSVTVIKTTYTLDSGYGNNAYMPKTTFTYEAAAALDYDAKVTPTSLDFGSAQVNGTSELSVALKNKGTNDLTYTISGLDAPFSTTVTGGTLAAGADDLSIPVTFAPTATGSFEDDLVITFGSETGLDPITVHVTGTGSDAICDGTDVNENIPVYGYNFDDNQQINQMIYPKTKIESKLNGKRITGITFYPATYTLYSTTYSGINFYKNSNPGTVTFKLKNLDSGTAPYASTPVRIEGATTVKTITMPTSAQTSLTEWVIEFDDAFDYTGGDLLIEVETAKGGYGHTYFYGENQQTNTGYYSNGSGGTPQPFLPKVRFAVEEAGNTPTITVNPATLDAFSTEVGTAVTKTVTVTGTNLTGDITVAANGTGFSVSPTTIAAADAANGVTVTVTYNPTAAGNHTATVTLSSTGAQDVTIALTGTATAPVVPTITVNPTTLNINAVVGETKTASFTVTGTDLSGDITVATNGDGFSVSPTTITAAEAANGKSVLVTYSAQEAGTFTGTVTLTSEDAETKTVTVTANVVAPVISGTVSPTSISFGDKQVGQSYTETVTVTNTGNTVFTPNLYTANLPEQFSVTGNGEVAVGGSRELTVTYTPDATGSHTGSFNVIIGQNSTTVNVGGIGVEGPTSGDLTVASGTTYNYIAPIYGAQYTKTGWVQMLYPASMLTDLNDRQITKITFYSNNNGIGYCAGGVIDLLLGETDATDLSSSVSESVLKTYATITGILTAYNSSTKEYTITLTKPYVYNGGNLLIETKVTTKGTSSNTTQFLGASQSNNMIATSYSPGTGTYYSTMFLPKATFTYEKVTGVEVEPEGGELAFGEVSTTGSRTLYITVTNHESVAVTPTLTGLAEPFSSSFTGSIEPGATVQIPVKFSPTVVDPVTGSLTLSFEGTDLASYTYTLTGYGRINEPTMTDDDFAALTYDWTDSEGVEHKDTPMNEVATSAEQMVALMKAVYTNKNVPGNLYRGFTADGVREADMVSYPAVGSVSSGAYSDSYGWGIGTEKSLVEVGSTSYLDPTEYIPNAEGLTVLLVEMNDQDVAVEKATEYGLGTTISGGSDYQSTSSYADLVKKFDVMFKSVRVLTSSKNMGGGEDAGTLFKIDCDKMNRFFLLAKGHLRTPNDVNKTYYAADGKSYQVVENSSIHMGPFYGMFEQFSPNVAASTSSAMTDIYQNLVNMESFGVIHDCVSIPSVGGNHEFNLYGVDSPSDDCQDVRDMMFLIPERRMTYWYDKSGGLDAYRDPRDHDNETGQLIATDEKYQNYHLDFAPKIGLFVIKQYPITGEQIDGQDTYKLHLTWTSNLLDFLPGEDGVYNLYRVTINDDGSKTYTQVAQNLDPNTFEYYDDVPMEQNGQQVTYVVRGQDKEQFLTLQMSNEESFIIPGLDKAEQLQLDMNYDYYYSRFNPQTAKNYYSNRFVIKNNIGTNVKAKYLADGTVFTFYRVPNAAASNQGDAVAFATATVTNKANGTGTLTIAPVTTNADYWDGTEYVFGYEACPTTATFTYDVADENSDVQFNNLKVVDNFWVAVAGNEHPTHYAYYVALETATPFELGDGTTSNAARSNSIFIPTHKTAMNASVYDKETVDGDVTHELPLPNEFDITVKQSSKSEILAYYAYRWDSTYGTAEKPYAIISGTADNEVDISPNGQAGNQGEFYTVAMNADYTSQVDFTGGATSAEASFIDNFIATAPDLYTYAPVVEVFAPAAAVELDDNEYVDRKDYNTYGASLQTLASGKLTLTPGTIQAPEYTFTTTADGRTGVFTYYTIPLGVTVDIPTGFDIYKVRAWRQVDLDDLGEEKNSAFTERRAADYLFETNSDTNVLDFNQVGETENGTQHGSKVYTGTFGARKVTGDDSFDATFIVRVYFTRKAATNTFNATESADGKYYIAEAKTTVTVKDVIYTGVVNVDATKQVAGVKYYNMAGMESDTPFNGVNIIVTRYTDGSTSTSKVMR